MVGQARPHGRLEKSVWDGRWITSCRTSTLAQLRYVSFDVNYQAGENDKDWLHTNSIAYNAELDQILISSRDFNELWVIDHDVPADLVSGPAGNLLYRWGNPEAYGRGTEEDRVFHSQHDARWIDNGQMMVFSNGNERLEGLYSTVELFTPHCFPTEPTASTLSWPLVRPP